MWRNMAGWPSSRYASQARSARTEQVCSWSPWGADDRASPLLVGLAGADHYPHAVGVEDQIGAVEGYQLRAAKQHVHIKQG